jgi:hypothetical protein
MARCFAFFGLLLIVLTGCVHTQPTQNGIVNYGVVDEARGIYRGGDPSPAGWEYLRLHGVTNVVKLNTGGRDSSQPTNEWQICYCPISTWQQFAGGKTLDRALLAAEGKIQDGTYIHCTHGKNRTGTLIGIWRLKSCHYTKEQSMEEMRKYGWADSFPGLKSSFYRIASRGD